MRTRKLAVAVGVVLLSVAGCKHVEQPLVRFGVLSDMHLTDRPTPGLPKLDEEFANLRRCVAEFNRQRLDFVINLGDSVDRQIGGIEPLQKGVAILKQTKAPLHHVLGNHDMDCQLPRLQLLAALGIKDTYYDFVVDNYRFVTLSGCQFDQPEFARKQQDWLAGRLAASHRLGQSVVIFNHYPICDPRAGERFKEPRDVPPMIERVGCVIATVAGHYHQGGGVTKNGIHHVVVQAMVNEAKRPNFAVVSIYPNRIEVNNFGAAKDVPLKLPAPPSTQPASMPMAAE